MPEPAKRPISGLDSDALELYEVATRDRWGRALLAMGGVHLAVFLICQTLYGRGDRSASHFLPLWGFDVVGCLGILRRTLVGSGRGPTPSLFRLVSRVWLTFLILAFSTASLNSLIGFETDWFKAIWATLSTFGFATMAWILSLKFLIPAVQMSLTAILIARFPDLAYGIYGASWCLALTSIGLTLERRRSVDLDRCPNPSRRPRQPNQVVEVR